MYNEHEQDLLLINLGYTPHRNEMCYKYIHMS